MADITIKFNTAELHRLLNSPSGPVAKDLERRGKRVETQAKVNATGTPGPRVKGGRLRSSIKSSFAKPVAGGGLAVEIGSNVEYAVAFEKGGRSPPHFIGPSGNSGGPGKGLANPGSSRGKRRATRTHGPLDDFGPVRGGVMHPGSIIRPKPFLAPALRAAR